MVYCGKPSRGCHNCREKRTKCDRALPSCGQCKRTGRVCLGYRDEASLAFRDQSHVTASKFNVISKNHILSHSSTPSSTRSSTETSPEDESQTASEVAVSDTISFSYAKTLVTLPEDLATNYFFRNYVISGASYRKGINDHLPSMFGQVSRDSPLSAAIASIGLAGLANTQNAPGAEIVSAQRYASALKGVNADLRNPVRATADETLVTVILLGLYETNTGRAPQSLRSWLEHINGAMALINLRGKEQLQQRIGLKLFYHLRTQIVGSKSSPIPDLPQNLMPLLTEEQIVGCMHRRTHIPPNLIVWSRLARDHPTEGSESALENRLAEISFQLCNFRADEVKSTDNYSDPPRMIEAILEIDQVLEEWQLTAEKVIAYTTVSVESRSEDVFSDYYHVYPDDFTALLWNHFRSDRLVVHWMLTTQIAALYHQTYMPASQPLPSISSATYRNVTLPADFPYTNQFKRSHAQLTSIIHDICASVPYLLGYHQHGSPWENALHHLVALKGNLLMWPLYLVGQMSIASPMMRRWATRQLKKIGTILGVKQAEMLASLLEKGLEVHFPDRAQTPLLRI